MRGEESNEIALPVSFFSMSSVAVAVDKEIPFVPSMLQWVMSIFGMVIAIFGLFLISSISNLTKGGAISGNAHYIILAFLCLGAASVLSVAVYSFDLSISDAYIAHLESALRIVSMGFFIMYFYNMLNRLQRYLHTPEEFDSNLGEELER